MTERFESDKATDQVTILFASAMLSRPSFAPYRFQMVTSLWCHYRSNPFAKQLNNDGKGMQMTSPSSTSLIGSSSEDDDHCLEAVTELHAPETFAPETVAQEAKDMVDIFFSVLFGRHATIAEVDKWNLYSRKWLNAG